MDSIEKLPPVAPTIQPGSLNMTYADNVGDVFLLAGECLSELEK